MTDNERQELKKFDAKIRRLLDSYRVMQREIADLYVEIEIKDEEIKKLKEEKAQLQKDYDNLKLAKMIQIGDNDLRQAKQRISYLVREVNKCINLLKSEQED